MPGPGRQALRFARVPVVATFHASAEREVPLQKLLRRFASGGLVAHRPRHRGLAGGQALLAGDLPRPHRGHPQRRRPHPLHRGARRRAGGRPRAAGALRRPVRRAAQGLLGAARRRRGCWPRRGGRRRSRWWATGRRSGSRRAPSGSGSGSSGGSPTASWPSTTGAATSSARPRSAARASGWCWWRPWRPAARWWRAPSPATPRRPAARRCWSRPATRRRWPTPSGGPARTSRCAPGCAAAAWPAPTRSAGAAIAARVLHVYQIATTARPLVFAPAPLPA